MSGSIIGKEKVVERILIVLLGNGNMLLEGLPGLAKTRAIKILAKYLDVGLSRIQFTPDLLLSDITGTKIYVSGGRKIELIYTVPGFSFNFCFYNDQLSKQRSVIPTHLIG